MGMEAEEKVTKIIAYVKKLETDRERIAEYVYTHGNCGYLFYFLKLAFPEAEPYGEYVNVNSGGGLGLLGIRNVLTKIGEQYFDITGERKDFLEVKPLDEAALQNFCGQYEIKMQSSIIESYPKYQGDPEENDKKYFEEDCLKISEFIKNGFMEREKIALSKTPTDAILNP